MPFTLNEDVLARLFKCANFELPSDQLIFAGLRGCVPVAPLNNAFGAAHDLELLGVDYKHLRCTLVQWSPGNGLAVYPGSTVPNEKAVISHMASGGAGANELAVGYYRDEHRYARGDHSISHPDRRHRAFRNDSPLPVRRTADDAEYAGSDPLTFGVANDNLHCAWQQDPAAATYSSNGCQVVVGRPRIPSRGWEIELGPWASFVDIGYQAQQNRFCYGLFTGQETLAAATAQPGSRPQSVRFGSEGALVTKLQLALIEKGYDLGDAGADGDLGWSTLSAIRQFQLETFGPGGADLVVGPTTAAGLRISWPTESDRDVSSGPASMSGVGPAVEEGPTYRSLAGKFFSSNPWDLSVKRSIRTNNPGALNVTRWQRTFRGFAGVTQPDSANNVTTIYWTPEHGVAAWHYLMTDRYRLGPIGRFTLEELAMMYAGISDPTSKAVKSYLAGWRRRSGNVLDARSVLALDNNDDMVVLARGMFGHECAGESPIDPAQVRLALDLQRAGTLPPY